MNNTRPGPGESAHPGSVGSLPALMARVRSCVPWSRPGDNTAKPGALLFFKPPGDADFLIQWLVCAEGKDALLLVPVDDHPLAGPGDWRLARGQTPWPMVARCDLATWVPRSCLSKACLAGQLPDAALQAVLVAIRCQSTTSPTKESLQIGDPGDPELVRHLGLVQLCVDDLLARYPTTGGGEGPVILRFSGQDSWKGLPAECGRASWGLAAAGPGHVLDELERLEAEASSDARTLEHPLAGGLTLVLMANDRGVLPAIRGASPLAIARRIHDLSNGDPGQPLEWEQARGLLVSNRRIPWREGRVVLGLPDGTMLEFSV